ncbi:unnamed protein product, partial [Rangifer tarandus platyrhynchus]
MALAAVCTKTLHRPWWRLSSCRVFGRSVRSRHILLVLQLLESTFLYDYFRKKIFVFIFQNCGFL